MAVAVISSLPTTATASFLTSLGAEDRDQLARARLLDVVAALAGLNGATIVVAVPSFQSPLADFARLPAGVNFEVVGPSSGTQNAAMPIIEKLRQQRFERIVVIAGDALPVPPKTAATALSVLEQANMVLGLSRRDEWYALGANSSTSLTVLSKFQPTDATCSENTLHQPDLIIRHLERRTTLSDIPDHARLLIELDRLDLPASALLQWAVRWR